MQQIAVGYRSRERFLTELTLDPPDATSGSARATQLDEDYTILSTIHSAKGGEWKIVRVLNVVDGCIPSAKATRTSDEIEEERRLLYVAMTRAKDELDLIVPQRLFMYQQNGHDSGYANSKMSRFIRAAMWHSSHSMAAKWWPARTSSEMTAWPQAGGAAAHKATNHVSARRKMRNPGSFSLAPAISLRPMMSPDPSHIKVWCRGHAPLGSLWRSHGPSDSIESATRLSFSGLPLL